jgi:hypothetical protein
MKELLIESGHRRVGRGDVGDRLVGIDGPDLRPDGRQQAGRLGGGVHDQGLVVGPALADVLRHRRVSASGYGSGRSRTALTTLKIAVLALMPSASVSTATAAKPGFLRRMRTPWPTSRPNCSSQAPDRTARTCSFHDSTPPSSRRADRRAAADAMPCRIFSSASSSQTELASSASSRSTAARWRVLRLKLRSRAIQGIGPPSYRQAIRLGL